MKRCWKCAQSLTLETFGKDRSQPDGLKSACKPCRRAMENARYQANPLPRIAKAREWYRNNAVRQTLKCKEWGANNPGFSTYYKASYMAAKKGRFVDWADQEVMKQFYARSADISRVTGIEHHVDHVIPFRSPVVSGLHNEFNLQILSCSANCSKQNKVEERI